MPRHAWSLADELATLARAVEAARGVADAASIPSDKTMSPTAAAAVVAGVLALVSTRLRDLGRVMRGELDPTLLRAPHNAVEPEVVDDAGDVIFRAWGPKRRAAHARQKLARAEGDRDRTRR